MAIITISQAIQRGRLSVGYAAIDNAKGNLYSPRLNAPASPRTIAMVTDALDWSTEGAQTAEQQREIANYQIWLCGVYQQEAAQRLGQTNGGGSLTPGGSGGTTFSYPLRLTGSDFEVDGVTYNNPNIVGANLMIFVSNFNEEWQFAPTFFNYTSSGIVIVFPDFNANNYDQIIIQNYFNP